MRRPSTQYTILGEIVVDKVILFVLIVTLLYDLHVEMVGW